MVAVRDDRVLTGSVDLSVEAHLDVAIDGLPEEAEPGTTVVDPVNPRRRKSIDPSWQIWSRLGPRHPRAPTVRTGLLQFYPIGPQ